LTHPPPLLSFLERLSNDPHQKEQKVTDITAVSA